MRRLFAGVALTTFATLLLEMVLTRIFSYTMYYHFAFLVISLALFGLGVSGVVVYLRSERYPRDRLEESLARHARRFAGWTLVALVYVLHNGVTGDVDVLLRPAFTSRSFFDLAMLYGVVSVPMYHSGMVVSLAVTHLRERIGELYFFDLAGAGVACVVAGPVLGVLGAENAVLLVAAVAATAAVVFEPRPAGRRFPAASAAIVVAVLAALACNAAWPILRVGSFKRVPEESVTFSKWNAFSQISVVEEPGRRPEIYIDASARTLIYTTGDVALDDPENAITALAYEVRRGGSALVIGPGGGVDVVSALRARSSSVTGVEVNPIIADDVMRGVFLERTGGLYRLPNVRIVVDEGRSFVRRSGRTWDVIQSTLVDTWAASAADAFALTENGLYTVEAFEEFLGHLTPGGILSVTRWCLPPDMECIRIASIAREALGRLGVEDASRHVFMATAGTLGTVLVRRTPFPPGELATLERACESRGLSASYSPSREGGGLVARILRDPDPSAAIDSWPSDLSPVTDDRPFFFYGVKPGDFFSSFGRLGDLMANSLAVAVLLSLLAIVTVLVAAFIVVPLLLRRRDVLLGGMRGKLRDLGFFAAIGVGFITLEVVLLQRFSLFLGHPSHSLAVVLFSLLVSSGIGSVLSGRLPDARRRRVLAVAALATAVLAAAYVPLLPAVFDAGIGMPLGARIAVSVLLVGLPGLAMGMMLPTGVRLIGERHPEIVPWGWGLNGAASVLGSVLAMVLAMNLGFSVTMGFASATYLAALAACWRRGGTTVGAGPAVAPGRAPLHTGRRSVADGREEVDDDSRAP